MRKLKILVLHSLGDPDKTPIFLVNHVFALRRYFPGHDYIYHDTTTDEPSLIADLNVDAIILDVTFLRARWAEGNQFETLKHDYALIKDKKAVKLAFPQDEYDCNELLDEWMCDWNIDILYSVIDGNWDVLYPRYSQIGKIKLAYTGYIDDSLLYFKTMPWDDRPIDIGYRSRKLPPYFGRIGEDKWRIGYCFNQFCRKTELVTDIMVGDAGTLNGKAWLDFINHSKFTLGANSGSSMLDPRGEIQKKVRSYLVDYPNAPFEDVEKLCFSGLDGKYEFTAISPRILEAGLLESCQILVEGSYSGILRPWEHYIPMKADASDFDQVYEAIRDTSLSSRLIKACKSELLDTKALRYQTQAQGILDEIEESIESLSVSRIPLEKDLAPKSGDKFNTDANEDAAEHQQNRARKYDVLLLVSHEPQRDPRLSWIVQGGQKDFIIHQLGISRIPDDKPRVIGSNLDGWIWSYPRVKTNYDLSVIRELISSHKPSDAILELSGLIAILSLSDQELVAVLNAASDSRIAKFRWYLKYLLQMTFSLVKYAEQMSGLAAVIATDLDTLIAGILLKERWGVPLIYDAHEFWPAADVEQAANEQNFWVALESRLLRKVDYAQTVSPGLAAYMSNLYRVPFTCIPNAEPLSALSLTTSQISPGPDTECRFLFQGGFAPARGIDLLIEIWPKTHHSAILVLRGPDNAFKHEMTQLAKSLGLFGSRILFVEPVEENQLVSAAIEFDVGLIPYTPTGINYTNCCPNKLSQYMASGLPILASRTRYVEEILLESGAGLAVDFLDSSQLIKEIDRLVLDKSLRIKYAENSKAFFQESFHWEAVSKVFYARLLSLVKQNDASEAQGFRIENNPPVFSEFKKIRRAALKSRIILIGRWLWQMLPQGLRYTVGPVLRRFLR